MNIPLYIFEHQDFPIPLKFGFQGLFYFGLGIAGMLQKVYENPYWNIALVYFIGHMLAFGFADDFYIPSPLDSPAPI